MCTCSLSHLQNVRTQMLEINRNSIPVHSPSYCMAVCFQYLHSGDPSGIFQRSSRTAYSPDTTCLHPLGGYGLSTAVETAHLLDHPGLGSNRPTFLIDQVLLFWKISRKMPGYIRDVVNPRDYKNFYYKASHSSATRSWRTGDRTLISLPLPYSGHTSWSPATTVAPHPPPFCWKRISCAWCAHRHWPKLSPTRGSREDNGWCFYYIAKKEFLALGKTGIICHSNSPWVSPQHLVPKKDSSWCPCALQVPLPNRQSLNDRPHPHIHARLPK